MRGRQPGLERHVGFAWLYCYAAYKLSCAQLIPTSKPEHCCFGTLPFSEPDPDTDSLEILDPDPDKQHCFLPFWNVSQRFLTESPAYDRFSTDAPPYNYRKLPYGSTS